MLIVRLALPIDDSRLYGCRHTSSRELSELVSAAESDEVPCSVVLREIPFSRTAGLGYISELDDASPPHNPGA